MGLFPQVPFDLSRPAAVGPQTHIPIPARKLQEGSWPPQQSCLSFFIGEPAPSSPVYGIPLESTRTCSLACGTAHPSFQEHCAEARGLLGPTSQTTSAVDRQPVCPTCVAAFGKPLPAMVESDAVETTSTGDGSSARPQGTAVY